MESLREDDEMMSAHSGESPRNDKIGQEQEKDLDENGIDLNRIRMLTGGLTEPPASAKEVMSVPSAQRPALRSIRNLDTESEPENDAQAKQRVKECLVKPGSIAADLVDAVYEPVVDRPLEVIDFSIGRGAKATANSQKDESKKDSSEQGQASGGGGNKENRSTTNGQKNGTRKRARIDFDPDPSDDDEDDDQDEDDDDSDDDSGGPAASSAAPKKKLKKMKPKEHLQAIADLTGMELDEVRNVMAAQIEIAFKQLDKVGEFELPGFANFRIFRKKASPAREITHPVTGEKTMSAPKPARNVVKMRPCKFLRAHFGDNSRKASEASTR